MNAEHTDRNEGIDLEAIAERYETRSLPARFAAMCRGLGKPRASRDYKEARVELQRMIAPLAAVVTIGVFFAVLVVVTATSSMKKKVVEIEIAPLDDDPPKVVELPVEPETPPEVDPAKTINVDISISSDIKAPDLSTIAPPSPQGETTQVNVQRSPSPVAMPLPGGVKFGRPDLNGFGVQVGDGGGGGSGGVPEGALIGEIIDLKRNAAGENRIASLGSLQATDDYWERVNEMVKGRFSDASCRNAYRLPMRVALSSLWIPPQSADNGPKAFGAAELMEPKYWVAHYSGTLVPVKKSRCRFFGYFDDCLVVAIDGRIVLDVNWAMDPSKPSRVSGWKSPDPAASRFPAPQPACRMIAGDWIDFAPGKGVAIDIVCGEKPGGQIGGLLCIEEQGAEYEKCADGRPVWPLFTTLPMSARKKLELEQSQGYRIGTNGPRFNYKPRANARAQVSRDDVPVVVTF